MLECAPTLDRSAIKRAYFRALARHPPQSDAEGFRRLRASYERLTVDGGLEKAYFASPLDLDRELARYGDRFDRVLIERGEAARASAARRAGLEAWIDRLSRCKFLDVAGERAVERPAGE